LKHLKNLTKIQLKMTQTTKALSVAQLDKTPEVAKDYSVNPLSPAAAA
jgi:hypothetical protein